MALSWLVMFATCPASFIADSPVNEKLFSSATFFCALYLNHEVWFKIKLDIRIEQTNHQNLVVLILFILPHYFLSHKSLKLKSQICLLAIRKFFPFLVKFSLDISEEINLLLTGLDNLLLLTEPE